MGDLIMEKEERDKIIHEIIEDFDYENVLAYMRKNDWNHGNKAPTLESLISLSRGLLENLLDSDNLQFVSTGGFYAIRHHNYIELIFGIEDSFIEEETSDESDEVVFDNEPNVSLSLLLDSYEKMKAYANSLEKELEFYRKR